MSNEVEVLSPDGSALTVSRKVYENLLKERGFVLKDSKVSDSSSGMKPKHKPAPKRKR